MRASTLIKALASVCFVLIAVAVMTAWNSPATGYESSIYWSTPSLVWWCLLLSIGCGIAIIVHQAYRGEEHSRLWALGLALILLSNTVVFSLHILRGYAMLNASGDSGTHLAITQNILASGHFYRQTITGDLFYPATHLYLAQLSLILDSSPVTHMKWVPVLFQLQYVVFFYLLARRVLSGKGQVMLAAVAATALSANSSAALFPNLLANLALPMALLLLFKSISPGAWQWRALLALVLVLFPLFHQVATVALVVVLLTVPLARVLLAGLLTNGPKLTDRGLKFSMVALVVLIVWAGLWLSPMYRLVSGSLIAEGYSIRVEAAGPPLPSELPEGASHLSRLSAKINYAQYYGYSVAKQFFKTYASTAAYLLLALIAAPILWRRIRSKANVIDLASLYGPLAAIALLGIGLFFTAALGGPMRYLPYLVTISTLLAGFTLSQFVDWTTSRKKWLAMTSGCLVFLFLAGISANNVWTFYRSPYTLNPSLHSTEAEIRGMGWFIHEKDTAIYSSGWYYAPWRYARFLLAPEERAQRRDYLRDATSDVPLHLGYDKSPAIGQSYEEDTYVVLRELNRRVYVDTYPRMAEVRLLPSDFARLDSDPSIDKLYDNSGLDVWLARAPH